MPKTINDLVECCMLDSMPLLHVIVDYFGFDNVDDLSIILGWLYQGMIKIKGMDKYIIERAFWKNRLDKLIHDSYKIYGTSGYYKIFCKKQITIGKTYIKQIFKFIILISKDNNINII